MICAFQKRKFALVSLSEGGLPRAAAREEGVEDDAIEKLLRSLELVELFLGATILQIGVTIGWCCDLKDRLVLRSEDGERSDRLMLAIPWTGSCFDR